MNSNKCPKCSLVNFQTATRCKRCDFDLANYNPNLTLIAQPTTPESFKCPFCSSNAGIRLSHKIATGGWLVIIFLIFIFPLNLFGILIKTVESYCKGCNMKLA